MSEPCAVKDCQRTSRALCHCCDQNLCRIHLNEHDDLLNSQLNPFADELNQLHEQLNHINVKTLLDNTSEKLEHWRISSHRLIDEYFNEKKQRFDDYVNIKIHKQLEEINQLRGTINQLVQKQDTTIDDLKLISSSIQSVRREITQLEYKSFELNINPLTIDDKLIQIEENSFKVDFNLNTLTPPSHVIDRSPESPKPITSNNRVILMHHDNRLCLLDKNLIITKSIDWSFGWIWDMCWSSTLSRFFIITLNEIFILDENTMIMDRVVTKEKYSLCSCTCSDTSLYITTNELGSSICEFRLIPTIELINRWQPSDLCQINEIIQDMVFHKGTVAFIIENQTKHTKRMELRLAQTFEELWSIQFDIVDPLHNAFRLCLFNFDEWIVIDWKTSQLFYITKNGQIKSTCVYDPVPYRCCQFGSDMLAISTKNSINFHKI
ncbi:unnamed protein product [Adineta steineri]|uniref:Uncharacterized protein n=1 Tax=Adineta steineri TaxID=433720 RepID=A0A813YI57_9BILA|nr:unnamed protein product [Adineta steineri]CAF0884937.1 unnamed protein product [Adineta steineri]CAF1431423.1 unnamed protein product [Adineta steineri]CAF1431732.1 unnamed protein product [Adineta steineri]